MVVASGRISAEEADLTRGNRQDCSYSPDNLGAVYTPIALADWTAVQLLREIRDKPVLRVLDPACGDGGLLAGVVRNYGRSIEVIGRDIDPAAVALVAELVNVPADLATGDSLLSNTLQNIEQQPDAVIMNPPWNGLDAAWRHKLRDAGYELAQGQFDLYEIFVERVVKLFPGIPMAFILPDSVLLPEHSRFRRFLLKNKQPSFIARLGEGLFPGVSRGTVVMVLRGRHSARGSVECFRLRAADRKAFLGGLVSLEDLRESQSHEVPLRQFVDNPNAEFTLEVRSGESAVDRMMRAGTLDWGRVFSIGRGVEIGKDGRRLCCPECGFYHPVPRRRSIGTTPCSKCGAVFQSNAEVHQVVWPLASEDIGECELLIVGEDVDRYRCEPSRKLQLGLPGIQYKDIGLALQPKLLVRKTGVGIRAAVDRSGSLTTQTVFHFIAKAAVSPLLLDYVVAVLNSRAMLAFHLRWSGDLEWRSHPYVTPTVIKSLPIPSPFLPEGGMSDISMEISALAQRRFCGEIVESQIEELVADLFELSVPERRWVTDVISSAQSLRGIIELKQ